MTANTDKVKHGEIVDITIRGARVIERVKGHGRVLVVDYPGEQGIRLGLHLADCVTITRVAPAEPLSKMTETAPKPCDCPDDAKEKLGNVIVTGHTSRCVHGEPRRYVWLDGGEMYVGTLADWARAWEFADRDGALAELSFEIRTWEESFQVEVTNLGTDDEDWTKYALTVGNETAHASVDGRV